MGSDMQTHAERDGAVLTICLGERLDYAALEVVEASALEAAADAGVRALIVRGAGEHFCRGQAGSMGELPERFAGRAPTGDHGPPPVVEQAAISALRNLMKPTVALLQGECIGLGLDLAAVCDLRIAARSSTVQDNRIHLGIAASTGISYVLPRLIGQSQATRVLLLGETLDAAEAHRVHLVHELVDDADFETTVEDRVATIAALPTRAWEVHKLQVLPQLDLSFDAAMVHCLGVRQTHVIEDQAEGIQAWRERREPRFTGR